MRPRQRAQKITDGVFAAVIRAYLTSPKFQGYAPATIDAWGRELKLAGRPDTLGSLSIYEVRPALVQAFLDGLTDRPAKQANAYTALKALEKWAIVRDLLPHPITTGVEVEGSDGGHVPWADEHVESAERLAREPLARVVTLAANTGQRGSDLVKMRWTDVEEYEGRLGVNVVQKKTGKKLWVPFTQPLLAAIEMWERRPGFILLDPKGRQWGRKAMTAAWTYERDNNASLRPLRDLGLVLHGLRATACVRLNRSGANSRQISDWIGMSEPMVQHYLRFSVQRENALAAVIHLDRSKAYGKILKSKDST